MKFLVQIFVEYFLGNVCVAVGIDNHRTSLLLIAN
jgi:hypothetical protein